MHKMKIIMVIFLCVLPFAVALQVGFYSNSCPNAEAIVRDVVRNHFLQDATIPAGLLRLHFHDCFVRGCDASILIDPTTNRSSEKTARPNRTVRGYEIIDEAKSALERICPSTVSCADIIALAVRDSVSLSGGLFYNVPTGRLDSLVSNPSEVNIPGPSLSVPQALQFFTARNLTLFDMVTLLGAHTVGFVHCSFFKNRLSSFRGSLDPTMDPLLDAVLVSICGSPTNQPKGDPVAVLNDATPFGFDNFFYGQTIFKRGVLNIDQQLALDPSTSSMVTNFAMNPMVFQQSFADAMVKMGSIGVLSPGLGEVRRNCRAFNSRK